MDERKVLLAAFIGLTMLITFAVIFANLSNNQDVRESEFSKWGMYAVLGEIIAATLYIAKKILLPDIVPDFIVDLKFERLDYEEDGGAIRPNRDINLDMDKCKYQIREFGEKAGPQNPMDLKRSNYDNHWQCRLPASIKPSQVVEFELKDQDGIDWKVDAFPPFQLTKEAKMR